MLLWKLVEIGIEFRGGGPYPFDRGSGPNSSPGDGTLCAGPAPSGREKICAVSRLPRRVGDLAATRNALIGRQRRTAFDLPDEQIEGALRVRLDQFELREQVLESLDVVSVLHLVQPVRRRMFVRPVPAAVIVLRDGRDVARVGARVMINGQ